MTHFPPPCVWASSNPLGACIEQKLEGWEDGLTLCLTMQLGHQCLLPTLLVLQGFHLWLQFLPLALQFSGF